MPRAHRPAGSPPSPLPSPAPSSPAPSSPWLAPLRSGWVLWVQMGMCLRNPFTSVSLAPQPRLWQVSVLLCICCSLSSVCCFVHWTPRGHAVLVVLSAQSLRALTAGSREVGSAPGVCVRDCRWGCSSGGPVPMAPEARAPHRSSHRVPHQEARPAPPPAAPGLWPLGLGTTVPSAPNTQRACRWLRTFFC